MKILIYDKKISTILSQKWFFYFWNIDEICWILKTKNALMFSRFFDSNVRKIKKWFFNEMKT